MRIYNPQTLRYQDVSGTNPLPVAVVDQTDSPTADETITVTVTRNADGDTTQVIEHSSLTDKTTTTNFTYQDA